MNLDTIPAELKKLPQWVCWTTDKLPKNPKTGGNAMSNTPGTWSDFQTAVAACDKYHFDGVGFMFANGYFGVDMDDVVQENQDLVDEFVHTLRSYTEYSKSGKGIHIICRGALPAGGRRKGKIEMYSEGRYFIMTGHTFTEYTEIRDCTDTIKILHHKYLDVPQVQTPLPQHQKVITFDDAEIIDKAKSSKSGWLFGALYAGNWQGMYPSQSEADLAILNILAFWTRGNALQMDRIYRSSNLMRPKWDKKQGGTTWGALQIAKACNDCTEVYDPEIHKDIGKVVIKSVKKIEKPYAGKAYRYDDTGNAERFADTYKEQIKYSHVNKKWYFWDGKKWALDNTGEIRRLGDHVLNEMTTESFSIDGEDERKAYQKHVRYTASLKAKTAMIKGAEQHVPILPEEMDTHKELLNCQSGVFDCKAGKLQPHDNKYLMSRISFAELPPAADKEKKPEKWLKFLNDITGRDVLLQGFLQRAVGYSLTGSTREQCMFVCYGSGQNGKSTFLDIVSDLCGTYAANVQVETLMVKNTRSGNAPSSDIARLKGVRFVTTAEPTEGMRFNEGLIKQLTGGDKVTARFLRGDDFEFEPEFKLWMAANTRPIIRGTDEGIWRRLKAIPFNVYISPDKIDKSLKHKLRQELSLIFRWALDGCMEWQKIGLKDPPCIIEASAAYRNDMDVISHFVDDCIQREKGEKIKAIEAYQVFKKWAEENGEYGNMSNTKFGREFSKRFNKIKVVSGLQYEDIEFTQYGESFIRRETNPKYFY